jgi:PEP-CTERM motif
MKTKALTIGFAVLVGIVGSQPAGATTLTTYTDQTAFEATTTVATQTFGFLSNTIGAGGIEAASSLTLNSATNDGSVSPGDIVAGLSISTTTDAGGIDLLGPDYGGSGSANYSVFYNFSDPANGLDFTLDSGVTAFSLGVLSFSAPSDVTVSIYDTASLLLGSFTVSSAPSTGVGEFFGVTTDGSDTIGSVVLSPSSGSFAGVDQIQFGQTSAPEPGSLLMLALGLAGLGCMVRLKSRKLAAVYSQV